MFGFGKKKVTPTDAAVEKENLNGEVVKEDLNADMASAVLQDANSKKSKAKAIMLISGVAVLAIGGGLAMMSMAGGSNNQPLAEVAPKPRINVPKVEAKVATDTKIEQDKETGLLAKKKTEEPIAKAETKESVPPKAVTELKKETPAEDDSANKRISIATAGDTRLLDGKQVADEVKLTTDQVKNELVGALAIGGGGNLDAFLQKYQKTIDNKQLEEQIESNIKVMETAHKFLSTKIKYDETVEAYTDKLNEVANRGRRADLREEFNAELKKMENSVASLRKDNEKLKEAIETSRRAGKAVSDGSMFVQGDNHNDFDTANGFIKSGENIYLAGTYNGVNYTQTIYRIGDTYIMEEVDDLGNITVYRQGMIYRGGLITSIGQDLINLKRGAINTLISVGGAGSGSQSSYNYITIGMPSTSTVKNSEQIRPQSAPQIRDYRDVQADRAKAEAAERENSNFFSTSAPRR